MCEAAQHSDQMHCDRCDLTWDMNDPEPPQCLTPTQLTGKTMSSQPQRPTAPTDPSPTHYQNYYRRNLTADDIAQRQVSIKLDPYRICEVLNIGGGAREQILKKAIRWDTKGAPERQVLKEIMQACERRLEMLDEDDGPLLPPLGNMPGAPVAPPLPAVPGVRR